jgi:hypothetical protein
VLMNLSMVSVNFVAVLFFKPKTPPSHFLIQTNNPRALYSFDMWERLHLQSSAKIFELLYI